MTLRPDPPSDPPAVSFTAPVAEVDSSESEDYQYDHQEDEKEEEKVEEEVANTDGAGISHTSGTAGEDEVWGSESVHEWLSPSMAYLKGPAVGPEPTLLGEEPSVTNPGAESVGPAQEPTHDSTQPPLSQGSTQPTSTTLTGSSQEGHHQGQSITSHGPGQSTSIPLVANVEPVHAQEDGPLLEARLVTSTIVSKQSSEQGQAFFCARCIPNSAGARWLCFGISCLLAIVAVVAIICSGGICSASDEGNSLSSSAQRQENPDAPVATPTQFVPSQNPQAELILTPQAKAATSPSMNPSIEPSLLPSLEPSLLPSLGPSLFPSLEPSLLPSLGPSLLPSFEPSLAPSTIPSTIPTPEPTLDPTSWPSSEPTVDPSREPSRDPTRLPTTGSPTPIPTATPTRRPSPIPTSRPTLQPVTLRPTFRPTPQPTFRPTPQPTPRPSRRPTPRPSRRPTAQPTVAAVPPTSSGNQDCPSMIAVEGNVTITFFFVDRGPTEEEQVEAYNATIDFFDDTFRAAFPGTFQSTVQADMISSTFDFDERDLTIEIASQYLFSPCAPSLNEAQSAVDNADYDALWSDYVRPESTDVANLLVFVEGAFFEGGPTDVPVLSGGLEIVITIEYRVGDAAPASPTDAEIDNLLDAKAAFYVQTFQSAFGDSFISLNVVEFSDMESPSSGGWVTEFVANLSLEDPLPDTDTVIAVIEEAEYTTFILEEVLQLGPYFAFVNGLDLVAGARVV
ncbi:ECF subfamily RNA polymerase sigma-24 subunit [Seminavis robusta]|uniref:Circumsporozoite protein n=1 Tax=Seminavis robusta TaxID=568900 RepID=A0A9N8H1Z5_9STRA|nr:ECF subfamily RNA polymerase sigma-24 subunit [Seminavis robusta]|eukprot:Sro10_g007930.1 ECF subfamily RNA polymerase sigma-24 subunit (733) ;mRNA; f:51268-53466